MHKYHKRWEVRKHIAICAWSKVQLHTLHVHLHIDAYWTPTWSSTQQEKLNTWNLNAVFFSYSSSYPKNLPQHPRRSLRQNASKCPSMQEASDTLRQGDLSSKNKGHQARVTVHTVTLYSLPHYGTPGMNPTAPWQLHKFHPRSRLLNDHHSSSQIVARTHSLHGCLKLFGSQLVSHILLDIHQDVLCFFNHKQNKGTFGKYNENTL